MTPQAASARLAERFSALCRKLLEPIPLTGFLETLGEQLERQLECDGARLVLREARLRPSARLAALAPDDGASRWILERREPLTAAERGRLEPGLELAYPEADVLSFAGVPVMTGAEARGALYALSRTPRSFGAEELHTLEAFAALAALALEQERRQSRLEEGQRTLVRFALLDPLTNLASQRQFDYLLRREWQRMESDAMPLALIQLEPDDLELRQGRLGGTPAERDALQRLARVLDHQLYRPSDLVARLGGGRFVMLLPATPLQGAKAIAGRLQRDLQHLAVPHPHHPERALTLSVGVAAHQPLAEGSFLATPEELLAKAEAALAQARAAGGDKVVTLA